ncbi:MAG: 5-(carboxyamino)imidazole ribonucleotide synthase [Pseudomonadota bacterium]
MIKTGSIIGIIGGGQLGRMMAIAGAELGYKIHIFTPEHDSPASHVAYKTTVASYDDKEALIKFAHEVSVITFEFENIPYESLALLEKEKSVFPSANILKITCNRVQEKTFLNEIGIETAKFRKVTNFQELQNAVKEIGLPAILKTCEMGYDGKGQATIKSDSDLLAIWQEINTQDAIVEGFVDFTIEISVIVARTSKDNSECYIPVHNIHKNHILDTTIVPANISPDLANEANNVAIKIAEKLDLRGLLAVEMFVTRDNKILVNELAPRPHNSGHWTMDAAITSQFEQIIRAVCGLPLGSTNMLCKAEMKNLIGEDVLDADKYLKNKNAKLYLYGKSEIRAGRKMGHVNILEF